MSSNSPTSKKRKADEISDECVVNVPHLPAPVWGGILDFMPYSEVRSALLVGKHIAVEAVKYVKTINVMNSSEMNVPSARRFQYVEKLNILCLLEGVGEFCEYGTEQFTVSLETAHSTPSFLSAFPRLKRAFVGGRLKDDENEILDEVYRPYVCIGPEGHEEIIRGLILTTAGAFKSGLLSPNLSMMNGINPYSWSTIRPCRLSPTESCAHCKFLCKQMPVLHLLGGSGWYAADCFCLEEHEFWELIRERPGGKEAIEDNNEGGLFYFLQEYLKGVTALKGTTQEKARLIMAKHSRTWADTRFWGLSKFAFDKLDKVIEAGLDPRRFQKENFFYRFNSYMNDGASRLNIWTKSTVVGLESRGFPVSCDDIITVDDS